MQTAILDQKYPPASYDVIDDVRRILPVDFTHTAEGEAYVVAEDLATALSDYPALATYMRDQIADTAQEYSSSFLSASMHVLDSMPDDLKDHDPTKVIVLDAGGTITQQQTIRTQRHNYGGTSGTTTNMSDLDLIESLGRERRLYIAIGAINADDISAVDLDYGTLIDTLDALGMDDAAIEDFIKILLSGDAPPELAAIAEDIVAMAKPGQTPEMIAKIQERLAVSLKDFADILPQLAGRTARQLPMLMALLPHIQNVIIAPPAAAIIGRMTAPPSAPSERISALKIIASVVQATAAIIRDPVLPAREKADLKDKLTTMRLNMFQQGALFTTAFERLTQIVLPLAQRFPLTATPITTPSAQKHGLVMAVPTSLPEKIAHAVTQMARFTLLLAPAALQAALPRPMGFPANVPLSPRLLEGASIKSSEAQAVLQKFMAVPNIRFAPSAITQPTAAANTPLASSRTMPQETINVRQEPARTVTLASAEPLSSQKYAPPEVSSPARPAEILAVSPQSAASASTAASVAPLPAPLGVKIEIASPLPLPSTNLQDGKAPLSVAVVTPPSSTASVGDAPKEGRTSTTENPANAPKAESNEPKTAASPVSEKLRTPAELLSDLKEKSLSIINKISEAFTKQGCPKTGGPCECFQKSADNKQGGEPITIKAPVLEKQRALDTAVMAIGKTTSYEIKSDTRAWTPISFAKQLVTSIFGHVCHSGCNHGPKIEVKVAPQKIVSQEQHKEETTEAANRGRAKFARKTLG
jgi:hypothetical protein